MYEIQIIDCQNPKFDKDMSVRSTLKGNLKEFQWLRFIIQNNIL